MAWLASLNNLRPWIRRPLKTGVVALTTLVVCFPSPQRFFAHVGRWRDPNRLIDAEAPELAPLLAEFRASARPQASPQQMLAAVQAYVYRRIPYAWDWVNWGNADYIPTVAEAIGKGREDCDGRAVVAASMLKALGYQPRIVTDFTHVWIATEAGQTMSPGAAQAVVAGDSGLEVQPAAWAQIPRSLGYGLRVFYLHRELIIVLACWLMWLRPGASWRRNAAALAMMIGGLLLLRRDARAWEAVQLALQAAGLAAFAAAAVALRRRDERAPAVQVVEPASVAP